MELILSKMASDTKRAMSPKKAKTPIAMPYPQALGSLLYWQFPSMVPLDEMQPKTIIANN